MLLWCWSGPSSGSSSMTSNTAFGYGNTLGYKRIVHGMAKGTVTAEGRGKLPKAFHVIDKLSVCGKPHNNEMVVISNDGFPN